MNSVMTSTLHTSSILLVAAIFLNDADVLRGDAPKQRPNVLATYDRYASLNDAVDSAAAAVLEHLNQRIGLKRRECCIRTPDDDDDVRLAANQLKRRIRSGGFAVQSTHADVPVIHLAISAGSTWAR